MRSYSDFPAAEELDIKADLIESIENFFMSGDSSLQEIVDEIGLDCSRIDDLLSQNTLDFSLGELVCYVSKAGKQTKVSVQ